jgi:cell division protease FtsH
VTSVVQRSLPGDVAAARERRRRVRLLRLLAVVVAAGAWPGYRLLTGQGLSVPSPGGIDPLYFMSGAFFVLLTAVLLGTTIVSGRSPHLVYRAEQIDVRMSDVVGIDAVREDVLRSLDLFLAGRTFRREMGGTPRRGLLFEGPPGTGKTHLAKAMAAEAGVPFLYVSATAFQSMYYGATARKIRAYFRALRRTARAEGGAIGFIEEIDAIATTRGGLGSFVQPASPAPMRPMVADCGGLVGLPVLGTGGPGPSASGGLARAGIAEGVGGVVN